ncbi:16S rRNA (guanine(966)-N(2))-methyltransferase |nr:16S rRNA (guanine(966)-N(2))-methyltransferase \
MTLDSLYGLRGARVLDLYAGSGAVGLEALSRGAAEAVLVESDPKAVRTIRANVAALGLDGARVVADKVERMLAKSPDGVPAKASDGVPAKASDGVPAKSTGPFGIVFADPPYAVADDDVQVVLALLRDNGWLADEALVAFERESRGKPLVWPEGYVEERVRRYGEASVWYGRAAGNP